MLNNKALNESISARLRGMETRASQQPISYKPLFDEAMDVAEDQFRRAMRAEAALQRILDFKPQGAENPEIQMAAYAKATVLSLAPARGP